MEEFTPVRIVSKDRYKHMILHLGEQLEERDIIRTEHKEDTVHIRVRFACKSTLDHMLGSMALGYLIACEYKDQLPQ